MASIEYSLFRAKFIKPRQKSLLDENLTPGELFLQALEERPSAELRKGYTWHIGNVSYFSKNTGYFAVGRTTNSTVEKFDEISGNFIEEELEKSPYTHCVFDANIGFVGIAKKTSLTQTSKGVAARIEELLGTANSIKRNGINVEIVPIPDPEGFLKLLISAYRVFRFSATFRGPNPFDADKYFQKPLAVYLSAAGGEKGKAEIQGDDLNREVLESVTRSTAATGNEASARIVRIKAQKPITINLKGDPVKRRYDEEKHHPEAVLADLTELYHKVRHDS
ncbi:hypothetical protein [Janthinobacterium sp. 78]|uniref:hypothetical protein n=1 Tax=Janthinobacterium sp. 78 TaxID=2135631 RepID=UPI000D5E1D30|nr:hypothetical protein [Janthinobacterium sp. 78]PVX36600.1 hypothetical protein C8C92_3218 [Janthinobacterium sp. 78]